MDGLIRRCSVHFDQSSGALADAHANQYFLNNGGQQAQGQQYGPPGHVGLSLPPGEV